jgi:integral membrane sensor domain MASE1
MSDRTQFALGTKKVAMPRVVKRSLQAAIGAALTAALVFAVVVTNTLLIGRGGTQGLDLWLAFIKRSDIIGTIILTALVTVSFVYWQRDRERR